MPLYLLLQMRLPSLSPVAPPRCGLAATSRNVRSAFTLIELLVVIAIIIVIAGFAIPSVGPMLKGSSLSYSGQGVSDQLGLARQRALTKNRTVEIRFYRYGDPDVPGEQVSSPASGKFRAMQAFEKVLL